MDDALDALRRVWAADMPITAALGITVDAWDEDALTLAMPLAPNRNHKGTAFAGSLGAMATLAGWSTLWLLAREAGMRAHVVIQDSSMHYLLPARSDVFARCERPDETALATLWRAFRRYGRGRIPLHVDVLDDEENVVAAFAGRYVVHRQDLFADDPPVFVPLTLGTRP